MRRPLLNLPVIASVSGGKDSTALCLWLRERSIPYRAVHMDTGWEHPATDEYLRGPLEEVIGPITWLSSPGFVAIVRRKGIFPSRLTRWCTQLLKMLPFLTFLDEQYPDGVVNAVGVRADESTARAKLTELEDSEYGVQWRPLLTWSEADVIDIHRRHGLKPNPLYLPPYNVRRVGCWPCIFARKAEIATVATLDPARIDLIRELESELQERKMERFKAGTIKCLPTFFYPSTRKYRNKEPWTIDRAVAWALSGKAQAELFNVEDRSGCLRWGLCDA